MRLKDVNGRLAIAMWDFTWLLQHQEYAAFEDWDKVLDELVERGYNAIRIDVFPQMVAADPYGNIAEEVTHSKYDLVPPMWGNAFTITYNPRKSIEEFILKCEDRGIYIGLSTWFFGDDTNRNDKIQGLNEFIRVWDETLDFLNSKNLLKNVIYVDLLNEYPFYHGFNYLTNMLKTMSEPKDAVKEYNKKQIQYYNKFITESLIKFKNKWTELDFLASITETGETRPWTDVNLKEFNVLDKHQWFIMIGDWAYKEGYWSKKIDANASADHKQLMQFRDMIENWKENKEDLIVRMEAEIKKVALIGNKHGILVGNTEGWGSVGWRNHPDLGWEFIKESGEICAKLCVKHGYKFICTSNFTHPHFGIWDDIEWHKKVTDIIKSDK
jgi:hypothetical protein